MLTALPRPWIVHLDVDDFMVQVERAAEPRLAGRPLVVGGETVTTGVVAAASREARQAGVRPGMLLAQARHRCPEAAYVAGALDRYLAATAAIDEMVRREADVVDWVALDEAALIPRKASASAGELRELIERLRAASARELGIALAVGAATSRTAARLAARLARPSGVVLVLSGYEERFLAPLDLGLLRGLSPSVESRLRARGIDTLGDLTAYPRSELRDLVGPQVNALLDQARGRDTLREDEGAHMPRSLSRTIRCSAPIVALDEALPLVRVMMGELLRTARARGYFVRGVSLRVEGADVRASRAFTFRTPTADDHECTSAAIALLRRIWRGLDRRPIHSLCGTLSEFTSARGQLSLFEAPGKGPDTSPLPGRSQWQALWAAKAAVRPRTARSLLRS